jgi:hypothetical protein
VKIKIACRHGLLTVDLNPRKAIREPCLNCCAWLLTAVSNCQFKGCHLYKFRSVRGKQNAKDRDKAIRQYCLSCMNGQKIEVRLCPSTGCSLYPYRMTRKAVQNSKNEHIGGLLRDEMPGLIPRVVEVRP